jgi:DNA-binding NarL/FixJ family response regulator
VVGEAADGVELLDRVAELAPDVCVVDVNMPRLNGIDAARELLARHPKVRVLMLTYLDSDSVVQNALRAGARGFLSKSSLEQNIIEAVRAVHEGRNYLSPEVAYTVVGSWLKAEERGPKSAVGRLTSRERRVLQLLAEGQTSKQVAKQLNISLNTALKHRANLMVKLGIHDLAGLVRFAIREGISQL